MESALAETRARCRPILVIEVEKGLPGEADLRQALRAGDVSAVIIRPAADNPLRLKSVVETAQDVGAAVLIGNDVRLASTIEADGVHLDFAADEDETSVTGRYDEARKVLGKAASIGAGVGLSRHLGMLLGERGAEYVAFGPAPAGDLLDVIEWWAEVVEVPCVAFAGGGEAGVLARAGADFVAIAADPAGDLVAVVSRAADTIAARAET